MFVFVERVESEMIQVTWYSCSQDFTVHQYTMPNAHAMPRQLYLNSVSPVAYPFLSILFNLAAVAVCVLVLCPLTGSPIACLLPL